MAKPSGIVLSSKQRQQLRQAREQCELSQAELAAACDCDRVTIVTLESGNRPVSVARIFSVARQLGLSPRIEF